MSFEKNICFPLILAHNCATFKPNLCLCWSVPLKGVFSGHKIMGEMVAIICVNITSVSFFHYFAQNFGGKHSSLIFGTQLSHPKITILNPYHINNYTVEFLESALVVFSRCGSCVPKMWQLCSKDVNVVF